MNKFENCKFIFISYINIKEQKMLKREIEILELLSKKEYSLK